MKKKVLYTLGILVVVLGGLLFAGQAWLKGRFEKEALVRQIEAEWNCRADLASSGASLFSAPAKVELKGLRLAPRDAEVTKPLAQRAPLDPAKVKVSMDRAELSVELWDLLHGKVNVKRLRFDGLGLDGEVDDEGRNSLQTLFESPDKKPRVVRVGKKKDQTLEVTAEDVQVKGVKISEAGEKKPEEKPMKQEEAPKPGEVTKPQEDDGKSAAVATQEPGAKGEPARNRPKLQTSEAAKEKKAEPFKAGDMPVSLQVDEAGIYNGRVEISDHGHGTRTVMDKLRFELKDVDVDPGDLATHNLCHLEFDGTVKLTKDDTAMSTADFQFNGSGRIKPFDGDGALNPDLSLDVMLKKGSQIGGATIKDTLRKKDAQKLNEYGIDLSDIALGGVLSEDVETEVHTFNGKLIVKKDTRLVFPEYEITVLDGSWFDSRGDKHKVNAKLIVSPELSTHILDQVRQQLADKVGVAEIADLGRELLKQLLLDDKGRMEIPFRSSGSLSKPEPNFDGFLGNISDAFKEMKGKLLFGK